MHGGRFSLIELFKSFAMLGAEWVMWVLVALSVASVAFMLERWKYYRSLDDDLEVLARELRRHLRDRDREGAMALLKRSPSPAAVVALAGIEEYDSGIRAAEEAMAGAVARVRINLERYLAFLGTVGNNAPFVGLFGTVIGIIQAFDKLRASEVAVREAARRAAQAGGGAAAPTFDTGAVMGTLAEALVATAIGLLVAIPAVAAYNYFQRRVKSILATSETLTHIVIGDLAARDDAEAHPYRASQVPAPAKDVRLEKSEKGEKAADKSDKPAEKASEKSSKEKN
ncbi:MAG: MotA/TolQ/ExbB proton channel family protein [Polyangiales bacterium]